MPFFSWSRKRDFRKDREIADFKFGVVGLFRVVIRNLHHRFEKESRQSYKPHKPRRIGNCKRNSVPGIPRCSAQLHCQVHCLLAAVFAVVPASSQVPPFHPCATDPAYAELEKIQYAMYKADPDLLKTIEAKERGIANGAFAESRKNRNNLQPRGVGGQRLPTCYEDPTMYWVLSDYAEKMQKAARKLGLPLKVPPRLGSVPSDELNAYTLPATASHGSIIVFNDQLGIFSYEMASAALGTIGVTRGLVLGTSHDKAIQVIRDNADLRESFAMSLIQFVLITPPSLSDIPDFNAWSKVLYAMEMFAVGHEYGHVIKKHASRSTSLNLEPVASRAGEPIIFPVLVRSWAQELEADQIGLQLLEETLGDEARGSRDKGFWLDSLYSVIFFFKCLELVDQTKYILTNGFAPLLPSMEEEVYLRSIANGTASEAQRLKFRNVALTDHPPAWLRAERIRTSIEKFLSRPEISENVAVKNFTTIDQSMVNNLDLLWNEVRPALAFIAREMVRDRKKEEPKSSVDQWRAGWKEARRLLGSKEKAGTDVISGSGESIGSVWDPRPGCDVEGASWSETFLCSPSFQNAIISVLDGTTSDLDAIQLYVNAVKEDWRLLSGAQVSVAEEALLNGVKGARDPALAVLALSGDKHSLQVLASLNTKDWSDHDRFAFQVARQFLEHYGRERFGAETEKSNYAQLKRADLLCFPAPLQQFVPIDSLIPNKGRNVSREQLAWSIWSDLLLRTERVDAALAYAPSEPLFGGNPNADKEPERQLALEHDEAGWALVKEHRYEPAIDEFRKAIQIVPDYPDARRNLCKALVATGQRQEGIAECRRASRQLHADIRIYQGEQLDKEKEYGLATPMYREAVQIDPDNVSARIKLATDLGLEDDYKGAVAELREAVRLAPNIGPVHHALALALVSAGDVDSGIAEYKEAIRLNPDVATTHKNLGDALRGKNQPGDAIGEYRAAIQLEPDSESTHYNLGEVLETNGETGAAISEFKGAIRLDPKDPRPHKSLAGILADKGQNDAAIEEYREVVRLDPNDANAHKLLGVILGQAGKHDEAIGEYREAARIKPNDFQLHTEIGLELEKNGQVSEAISEYHEALQLNPNDGDTHQFLATLFSKEKEYGKAILEFREAVRLKPNDAIAHALFAITLETSGKHKEAVLEAQKAHDLDSSNETIRNVYNQIAGQSQ